MDQVMQILQMPFIEEKCNVCSFCEAYYSPLKDNQPVIELTRKKDGVIINRFTGTNTDETDDRNKAH